MNLARAAAVAMAALTALVAAGAQSPKANAPGVSASGMEDSRQMLLVVTDGWDSLHGTAQRFERAGAKRAWAAVGPAFDVVVGEHGLGWGRGVRTDPVSGPIKKEGDGKGPAGVYRLGTAFGLSQEKLPGLRLPYLFLSNNVECVDDAQSKHYNQLVTKPQVGQPDWNSSEKMWEIPVYKWGVVVLHNTPAQAGGGSCIFLHIWKAPDRGTAGCTAMTESNLVELMRWLDPKKNALLVQLPKSEYERLKTKWQLP